MWPITMAIHIKLFFRFFKLFKPTHYPFPRSLLPPAGHSIPPGLDDVMQAGSCRWHGCREWSTDQAGGGVPSCSKRPEPEPGAEPGAGTPPPVKPHNLHHPRDLNSRRKYRGAEPWNRQEGVQEKKLGRFHKRGREGTESTVKTVPDIYCQIR